MIRHVLTSAVLLSLSGSLVVAQESIQAFGGEGERAEASVFLAKMHGGQFVGAAAAVFVTYGRPEWKDEYNDQVDDMTKGKIFRLGKDNWATFDSSVPVAFGGVTVPAGIFYLAMARDDAGKWSLVFVDPAGAKKAGAWPFAPEPAPRTHQVKLAHEKTEKVAKKLTLAFERDDARPTKGELVIRWGDHQVSASYELKIAKSKAAEASGRKRGASK